ncbi:unnamed protein product [Rotaria sordida]|uniref:Uncharacterized protein n=1 Tax=Rotaria sordida TaxID=392033 RepID=A0A819LYC1_9BILA|nr:unnamed protein product [Rotaria sordida]CAF0881967.1 unnamed protein product [Rotaria sordida]CAF1180874.1 unnamed protein product [Rotaria sordida]CAF3904970.1 unnamed protein product [Rotaria sordida]CAF3969723.1 unnamed protein product [Rotaria sordida]
MSSSTQYKLHYFDGRGRGEAIRLIFAYAGQKFEDVRYSFDEWPKKKNDMPLGQIPLLETNGQQFPQSLAIARYVARQCRLTGKDDLESMKCDVIVDTMNEFNQDYYRIRFQIKDENEKQTEKTKFVTKTVPEKVAGLEKLLKMYGNGVWAVGDNVTWADLVIYDTVENLLDMDDQVLNKFSTLKKHREAVEKLPKIAAYLANRKKTPF